MAEVINLNKVRKSRNKAATKQQADENAVKFGRTKVKKRAETSQKALDQTRLDGHKRETDD